MFLTSKSLEEQIEEEVTRRVRLKLRVWKKVVNRALDNLKLRWEEICEDGDVLPGEGQSRSDPAAAQLDGDNTAETDDSTGTDYTERDAEETQTNFMTSPNDTTAEEDDNDDESVDNDDFDTLRTSSPNRTEDDGVNAEDEYPASGRISDMLNHVPIAREVEEEDFDNLDAESPFVEPPSPPPPQAVKSKRKVADTPCPYCSKLFVNVNIHISKSQYCKEQRMQRRSGFMGGDDGPSAASTPINQQTDRR